jgi:hypothetical protein
MAGGQVVLMKSGANDANGITIFVVHAQSRFGMALMPIDGAVWQLSIPRSVLRDIKLLSDWKDWGEKRAAEMCTVGTQR